MLNYLTTYYNLNQGMHQILLQSHYYDTPSSTCFGPPLPIIREQAVVQNITMVYRTHAAPTTVVCAQLVLLHNCYIVRSFWLLYAENIKDLFCTVVCSLVLGQ
jgi:hypothetical protein